MLAKFLACGLAALALVCATPVDFQVNIAVVRVYPTCSFLRFTESISSPLIPPSPPALSRGIITSSTLERTKRSLAGRGGIPCTVLLRPFVHSMSPVTSKAHWVRSSKSDGPCHRPAKVHSLQASRRSLTTPGPMEPQKPSNTDQEASIFSRFNTFGIVGTLGLASPQIGGFLPYARRDRTALKPGDAEDILLG
jgi:hypothetical protein